ncbi:conserved hypothetical protein [Rickettsia prowazekii str. Rp22]|uniref:Uncharacterized protein n=1 Tax=Rickettsia prowazekii (strain Rp22) TaxID=449216 RepID=D5AYA1_RICPP|nr:conserved hypothetical protein [Rickettsia prowazekii str. Rp22]
MNIVATIYYRKLNCELLDLTAESILSLIVLTVIENCNIWWFNYCKSYYLI